MICIILFLKTEMKNRKEKEELDKYDNNTY